MPTYVGGEGVRGGGEAIPCQLSKGGGGPFDSWGGGEIRIILSPPTPLPFPVLY